MYTTLFPAHVSQLPPSMKTRALLLLHTTSKWTGLLGLPEATGLGRFRWRENSGKTSKWRFLMRFPGVFCVWSCGTVCRTSKPLDDRRTCMYTCRRSSHRGVFLPTVALVSSLIEVFPPAQPCEDLFTFQIFCGNTVGRHRRVSVQSLRAFKEEFTV